MTAAAGRGGALQALPRDVLRHIARRLDFAALCALSETSRALLAVARDEHAWRHLTARRFRAARAAAPARSPPSWRTLFAAWHAQSRMPRSRTTGPLFRSFVRPDAHPALRLWLCVSSADDCRLRHGALRARLVVQNIRAPPLRLLPGRVGFRLSDGAELHPGPGPPGHRLSVAAVWRADGRRCPDAPDLHLDLPLDDFAVVALDICLADAVFEVDILERLRHVFVPVASPPHPPRPAEAPFIDKRVWDAYQMLPGGWWVRRP